MSNFRFLFSPFFEGKLSPPEPFGFKMGWIAVRSTDPKPVAESLPIKSQRPASWHDAIDAAYTGSDVVFITTPITAWVCIVGEWTLGTGERQSLEAIAKIVSDLSSRFGEAHGYATYRTAEYHHWILAKQGQIVRCFGYAGERGE